MYRRIELMSPYPLGPKWDYNRDPDPQMPTTLQQRGIGGIWKMLRIWYDRNPNSEHPFTLPLKAPGRWYGKGYKSYFTETGWDANGRKLVGWLNRDKVPFRILTVKEDSVDVMYEDKWQVAVRPRKRRDAGRSHPNPHGRIKDLPQYQYGDVDFDTMLDVAKGRRFKGSLIAMDFPTQDAYDKYMKEHPDADKSLHTVKETKKEPVQKKDAFEDKPEENEKAISKLEKQHKDALSEGQKGAIALWGGLMAVNYDALPDGKENINSPRLMNEVIRPYMKAVRDGDDAAMDELGDWINEGAKYKDGTILMTKATYDKMLGSCQVKLETPMVVYRTTHDKEQTERESKQTRWRSFTRIPGTYGMEGSTEKRYVLPKGTPVIFGHDLADKGEIILDTKHITDVPYEERVQIVKDGNKVWESVKDTDSIADKIVNSLPAGATDKQIEQAVESELKTAKNEASKTMEGLGTVKDGFVTFVPVKMGGNVWHKDYHLYGNRFSVEEGRPIIWSLWKEPEFEDVEAVENYLTDMYGHKNFVHSLITGKRFTHYDWADKKVAMQMVKPWTDADRNPVNPERTMIQPLRGRRDYGEIEGEIALRMREAGWIYWHGSENPDIVQFAPNSEKFALLGAGVYFYKNKYSAKQYGSYLYKVNLRGLKIAPKGYEFNPNQIEGLMTNLGLTTEQIYAAKERVYGARSPVWWCTDGWNYFTHLDRKRTAEMVASFMKIEWDGMLVDYPNGGEVCVVWNRYNMLKPQLEGKREMQAGLLSDKLQRAIDKVEANMGYVPQTSDYYIVGVFDYGDNAIVLMHTKSKQTAMETVNLWKEPNREDVHTIIVERPGIGMKVWTYAEYGRWRTREIRASESKAKIFKPPKPVENPNNLPSVFLAGAIDMGVA